MRDVAGAVLLLLLVCEFPFILAGIAARKVLTWIGRATDRLGF